MMTLYTYPVTNRSNAVLGVPEALMGYNNPGLLQHPWFIVIVVC